ncbi:MAG: hypothetical protein ACI87H_003151, partial [Gammaproteobacteria bacterium]
RQRRSAPAAARPTDYAVDGLQQYSHDEAVGESDGNDEDKG